MVSSYQIKQSSLKSHFTCHKAFKLHLNHPKIPRNFPKVSIFIIIYTTNKIWYFFPPIFNEISFQEKMHETATMTHKNPQTTDNPKNNNNTDHHFIINLNWNIMEEISQLSNSNKLNYYRHMSSFPYTSATYCINGTITNLIINSLLCLDY